MQIVFQDPLAALNPRMTVGDIIAEPLITHEPGARPRRGQARVTDMMAKTGLSPQMINRYPHEFSGGQCQRIGIARAMILKPRLIVCDEPVSALDVSIQAQIINLLMRLQREFGLALLFISHDLAVVRHISHRILVLYLGRMMELADRDALYADAAPSLHQGADLGGADPRPAARARRSERIVLTGDLPSPLDSAVGLRVPHPLPARDPALRRRGARRSRRSAPATTSPATAGARSDAGHAAGIDRVRDQYDRSRDHARADRLAHERAAE